jgi:hypothetical protein
MQVMCTVCTKRTIGPKIIFDTLMVLLVYKAHLEAQKSFWMHRMEPLCDVGHVESHFSSFGCKISILGSEII